MLYNNSLNSEQKRSRVPVHSVIRSKKLVAFASLIILSPQIFLLDEISAGLSQNHLEIVIDVIKQLAANGKLIIIADHLNEILNLATKTINLDLPNG